MAFVAEDGTGLSTATSLVSLADANTYWTERQAPTEWGAASDAAKQAALLYATEHLEGDIRWRGWLLSTTQALSWPRVGVYDDEERAIDDASVPAAVKAAVCELAQLHLEGKLVEDTLDRDDMKKREKIDVLEDEWFNHLPVLRRFPWVMRRLSQLVAYDNAGDSYTILRG